MRLAAKILAGTTSFLLRVTIYDSTQTTPTGKTGLVYNTSGLTAYYIRSGSSSTTAITLATQTLGTWATGGFKEVDATNMPGVYELSVPNAVIASGAVRATICIKGTNIFCPPIDIELDAVNYQDGVRFGMTALPNVASGSGAGQLATVNRNQQIQLSTGGQVMPQNQWQTPTLLTTAGTVGGVTVAATGLNSFGADGVAIGWLAVIGNEVRTVIDYVDSTRTITVDRPFRVAHPTTEYIYLLASQMSPNVPIFGGIASAGASTTITLAGGSATDNFYNGMMVLINAGTGKGQQRIITGYVGSTKVATVSPAWITNPDSTSQVSVLADYEPAVDSSGAITTGTLSSGALTSIAGAVWNALTASYNTASTFGAYLQALPSASSVATSVWAAGTRTLTSFGTLTTDTATAVWAATTRTLSAFGFSVTVGTNNDKTGYALTSGEHTTIQSDVTTGMTTQGYTTARAGYLDTLNGIVAAVWAYATRTLTALANVTVGNYAAGKDPASLLFVTPANKLATNSDGSVNANATVAGTVTANVTQINGQSAAATHTVDFDQLATKSDVANSITGGAS